MRQKPFTERLMVLLGLLLLITVLFVLRSFLPGGSDVNPAPDEPLYVKGDLEQWVNVRDVWPGLTIEDIAGFDESESTASGVGLNELLDRAGRLFPENDLYLMADDGFMVRIDDSTAEDTYLAYRESQGWCYLSDKHPVNSRIKGLRTIVVAGKNIESVDLNDRGLGFNIIEGGRNHWVTRGRMLMRSNEVVNLVDGRSTLDSISIDVMKRHHAFRLSSLLDGDEKQVMLVTENGENHYLGSSDGFLEVSEEFITYIDEESRDKVHKVLGAITDPPGTSIMDQYYDAEHYLRRDTPVLCLFLDGFSYDQYLLFTREHPHGYFAAAADVREALSVFKPVTNAGFAAMITGQLPPVNGIHDRSFREPEVKTIFDAAESLGKRHRLVEGDIGILSLNTETILNLDENGDGLTDDEIFERAEQVLALEDDYLMIHFHSIDDCGHDYGPYGDETMKQIEIIEGYVEKIADQWTGMVIITADHGMHPQGNGGDHGLVVAEDMRVPYILVDRRQESK